MPHLRCYLATCGNFPQETITLDESESHHLVKVRRARPGDRVSVFDGKGNEWDCVLDEVHPKNARLLVHNHCQVPRPSCSITLVQALLKNKAMELVVEKATELGVSRIIPLATTRSVVYLSDSHAENKAKKWRAVAIKACKQSTNSFLPDITPRQSLQEFCQFLPSHSLKLMAALTGNAISLRQAYANYHSTYNGVLPKEAIWLVGPEGDFTEEEYILACACGLTPVTLGPTVLRAETAVFVALSLLAYELRELAKKGEIQHSITL